jgi:hypothetical protein
MSESNATSSQSFEMLDCGIQFHRNEEGELPDIPWGALLDAYLFTTGGRPRMRQRGQWVAGDIALYIDEMVDAGKWPSERAQEFVERLDYKDPNQIGKLKSMSRTFGWPDRLEENRRTPPLSHGNHIAVMGMKDVERRGELLDIAASRGLTVEQLRRLRRRG